MVLRNGVNFKGEKSLWNGFEESRSGHDLSVELEKGSFELGDLKIVLVKAEEAGQH